MAEPATTNENDHSPDAGKRVRPVRLQLSRKKGFNLQAHSRAVNGLPAVKVDRSTNWGNPYERKALGDVSNDLLVKLFRDHAARPDYFKRPDFESLRGKNLGCWCKLTDPCHADVLLELANDFRCEAAS